MSGVDLVAEEYQCSDVAASVIRILVTRSEDGRRADPTIQISEAASLLDTDAERVVDAAAELNGRVELRRQDGQPGGWDLLPTPACFAEFDGFFKDWDPRQDAERVVRELTRDGRQSASSTQIAEQLEWPPRRVNPALSYLIENGLVDWSRSISAVPYITSGLIATPETRNFVPHAEIFA